MTPATGVQFDMTINLSLVVGIIVWIVTLAVAWTKVGSRLDMLDLRVTNMETVLERLSRTLEKFAENSSDIKLLKSELAAVTTSHAALHQTVERMRVGQGFIAGPRRANLDGEYSRVGE